MRDNCLTITPGVEALSAIAAERPTIARVNAEKSDANSSEKILQVGTGSTCSLSRSPLSPRIEAVNLEVLSRTFINSNYKLKRSSRLVPNQRWEGFVEAIDRNQNTFVARLRDLEPGGSTAEEQATFFLEDVAPDDLELMRPGAIFRWTIGYRNHQFGSRERTSSIVFRRLPNWSEQELGAAKDEAQSLVAALGWS